MAALPRTRYSKFMAITQALLPEFDREMANTRKTLERVPDDKLGWKPHEKSMTLGRPGRAPRRVAGLGRGLP